MSFTLSWALRNQSSLITIRVLTLIQPDSVISWNNLTPVSTGSRNQLSQIMVNIPRFSLDVIKSLKDIHSNLILLSSSISRVHSYSKTRKFSSRILSLLPALIHGLFFTIQDIFVSATNPTHKISPQKTDSNKIVIFSSGVDHKISESGNHLLTLFQILRISKIKSRNLLLLITRNLPKVSDKNQADLKSSRMSIS